MSDVLLSFGVQNAKADVNRMIGDLESAFNNSDPVKIKVGLEVDKTALGTFKSQLSQIVNSISLSNGAPITVKINGLGEISSKTEEVKKSLDGISKGAKSAAASLDQMTKTQARDRLNEISRLLVEVRENAAKWSGAQNSDAGDIYNTYTAQAAALEKLRTDIEAGSVSLSEYTQRMSDIKIATDGAAATLSKFGKSADEIKMLEAGTKEYHDALKKTATLLDSVTKHQKDWTKAKSGTSSESYRDLAAYQKQLEGLIDDLQRGTLSVKDFKERFAEISSGVKIADSAIKSAGENTKTLSEHMQGLVAKFSSWLSVSQVIMFAVNSIKKMVTTVIELDSAMTELKKVTVATEAEYDRFLNNSASRAKKVGASLTDVVTATANFARLGYDIGEASILADTAIIYQNVADGLSDINEASESIISTMQAFGIEASHVMSIVDKFNNVSNNFAISSAGIGEALQRSAAAMYAAGNSLDQTIALITAANTIVQNPESVGTTMKTISMFLRAAKTEAEEAGESTEGMANSVSELREEILDLTGQKVDIQIDEDTFKSTYQILQELSQVWGSLTDISRANILELIGGKRNANVVSALLENFNIAEDALKASVESAGSAIAENEKHLDSIQGKLEKFTAQFESLSTKFISSGFVKGVVDLGTALLQIFECVLDVTNALGGLSNVLFTVAGITATLKIDSIITRLTAFGSEIKNIIPTLGKFGKTFKQAFDMARIDGAGNLRATLTGIASGFSEIAASASTAQLAIGAFVAVVAVINLVTNAIRQAEQAAQEANTALIQAKASNVNEALDLYALYEGYEKARIGLENNTSSKAELASASANLADALGVEQEAVDHLSDSYKNLTLEQLNLAISDANIAIDAAEKNLIGLMDTFQDSTEKGLIELWGSAYGFDVINGSQEERAKNLIAVYDLLVEEQRRLVETNNTETVGYKNISDAINYLRPQVLALSDANELLTDATNNYNNVLNDTVTTIPDVADNLSAVKKVATEAANETDKLLSGIVGVQQALNSQTTGSSISLEDFNTAELNGYSEALEYNNGALQLNAHKVSELVKAKADEQIAHNNTQKALAQSEYLENAAQIEQLRDRINSLGAGEETLREEIESNIDSLLEENSTLKSICTQYDLMSASIREATSAYQHWLNAQNASQTGDMFDSALSAMQHINNTLNNTESDLYGRVGRSDYQAAIDFIIPESVDSDDAAAVNSYLDSISDMFTYDESGNQTGLNIANFCQRAVDAGLMVLNEAGTAYEIAGGKTMEDFANGLNLAMPLVQAMFGELQEYGAEFDWADEAAKTIGDLAVTATEAAEALRSIDGNETLKLNIDVTDLETSEEKLSALQATIEEMQNLKVKPGVDPSEIEYANQIIEYCLAQKQLLTAPDVMRVDTSVVEGSLGNAIALMQQFVSLQSQIEMGKALDIDTSSAEAELASVASAIQGLDHNVAMALQIDTTSIDTISESISKLTADIIVTAGVDESAVIGFQQAEHDAEGTVTWGNDTAEVDAYSTAMKYAEGTVNWGNNTSNVRTHFTATGTVNWSNGGSGSVNGTAHVSGTARASGDWGTAPGGETLVGELGTEIVVDPHTGRWYTVGDTGAEFVNIPKDAIIFNHKQSESLLKYGYVAGRGNSMVSGTAMVSGSIPITGMWGGGNNGSGNNYGGSGNYHSNQNNQTSEDIAEDAKNAFEEAYKYHRHLLEMEQEDLERYLRWLEDAYQQAYQNGEIELDDYYKYEEEVYEGRKELFQDYLNDLEFKIAGLERRDGTEGQIINLYLGMIKDIKAEIAQARARGLNENDEYIQELIEQQRDYEDEIADIRENATDNAKSAVEDLIDYRIKMLKQDLENERDALKDKKDALKDFYDDQKDMLQKAYDDEKVLEERKEKRKAKTDIEAELDQLRFDDSAWAQKRKLELQEELAVAQKDLDDFEKEQVLDNTQNLLDSIYEKQAAQIETEIESIEAKLNDPKALYNQALRDIQNNTQALYLEMVEYNAKYGDGNAETVKAMWDDAKASLDSFLDTFGKAYKNIILVASPGASSDGYASGTRSASPGVKKVDEKGAEWLFTSGDGTRYRVFSGGEMVLNAEATKFLYDFAMDKGNALSNMFANLLSAVNLSRIGKQPQPVQLSTGNIIIQGNADQKTVSEIRRAQREGIDYILKQFTHLNK